ncbi:hypothetical protein D3C81_1203960 [compost metagenome]
MPDQVFNLGGQLEFRMVRAIRQLLVEDVAGGQGSELDRLARLVALEELGSHRQARNGSQLQVGGLDQLRVVQASGFAVEDAGIHADCS